MNSDEHWMRLALDQARAAGDAGEVPVGAVLVKDGVVIATGRNSPVASRDPCGHAEIHALREGAAVLGNYRLDGCELFVTLEPCAMCAGAMLHARIARVIYAARDPKTGAAGSVLDLFAMSRLNHRTRVHGDVLATASAELLQSFFRGRRERSRRVAQPLRDDALRTPERRFLRINDEAGTSDWSVLGHVRGGWRLHWLDSSANGLSVPNELVLCLHGLGQWNHLFRYLVQVPGIRWLAPDLIGFGKSDKPKRASVHTWDWHCAMLLAWLEDHRLEPVRIVHAASVKPLVELLVDAMSPRFATLPPIVAPDTSDGSAIDAWRAPFPDQGHEAALRALGRGDAMSSGPTAEQALRIGQEILGHPRATMGYFQP